MQRGGPACYLCTARMSSAAAFVVPVPWLSSSLSRPSRCVVLPRTSPVRRLLPPSAVLLRQNFSSDDAAPGYCSRPPPLSPPQEALQSEDIQYPNCVDIAPSSSTTKGALPPAPSRHRHPRLLRLAAVTAATIAIGAGAAAATAVVSGTGVRVDPHSAFVTVLTALRNAPGRIAALYGGLATLHPLAAAVVVALINFFSVALCFPANMGLMISAGAVLGPRNAFLALYSSKILAAIVTFLLGRSLLSRRAASMLETLPRLKRVLLAMGSRGGLSMVLMLRLSPFPGFLLNYLMSLTNVGFVDYAVGTAIGTLPSIANLVLIGGAARDVGVGATGGNFSWLGLCIKVLCIGSTVLTMSFVSKNVRKLVSDMEKDGEDINSSSATCAGGASSSA